MPRRSRGVLVGQEAQEARDAKPDVVCVASSTHPNRYSGAQDGPSQRPSIAASLNGWLFVTAMAWLGPK